LNHCELAGMTALKSSMCNLFSLTKGQAAIIAFVRVMRTGPADAREPHHANMDTPR
jgi:hypothetical protein